MNSVFLENSNLSFIIIIEISPINRPEVSWVLQFKTIFNLNIFRSVKPTISHGICKEINEPHIPVFHYNIVNYRAGSSKVRFRDFASGLPYWYDSLAGQWLLWCRSARNICNEHIVFCDIIYSNLFSLPDCCNQFCVTMCRQKI